MDVAYREVRDRMERASLRFPEGTNPYRISKRGGGTSTTVGRMVIGYDADAPLATVADSRLERGDRVAIVGANGTGKSTLLKSLIGEVGLLDGTLRWGANVETGYMPQHHEVLDPDAQLIDEIRKSQATPDDAKARNVLGGLLFSGDDAFKQVNACSGGQKARLVIAKLGLPEPNVLILDEPTNHLDVPTMDALQEALLAYNGTIIMVSHDRYLIQSLATRLIVLDQGQGQLQDLTWDEYQEKLRGSGSESATGKPAALPMGQDGDAEVQPKDGKAAYEAERKRESERRRLQREHDRLEALIHELEDERTMLEHAMAKASENGKVTELQDLSSKHQAMGGQIDRTWDDYAQIAEALDAISE